MPSLGADMESGRVVEWLVQPGDVVKSGQVIVVIETEKGAIDVEIFEDGVISAGRRSGHQLPVGALLAHVRSVAGGAGAPPRPRSASPHQPCRHHLRRRRCHRASRPRAASGRYVPARVRGIWLPCGLELAAIVGSGPDGAVLGRDVERAAGTAAGSARERAPRARGFDAAAMRHAIGVAMTRSKREIPHYYLSEQVALTPALDWLARYNAAVPVGARLLPAVLLLKASALALTRHRAFNGHFLDDAFQPSSVVHVGWAIALRGGGLIAPALHDVAARRLDDLMQALRDLVQRARGGGLRGSELTTATVTITSQGERGAEAVWPVIHPPQVAMIGFGRVVERPWVSADGITAQPVVTVSLAADHRVSDGHAGGLLLDEIARLLAAPASLDAPTSNEKMEDSRP